MDDHRQDVHDPAPVAARDGPVGESLHGEERPLGVRRHDRVPLLGRGIEDRAPPGIRRRVHKRRHVTNAGRRAFHHALNGIDIGHVDRKKMRVRAERGEVPDGGCALGAVAARDHEISAPLRNQGLGAGKPQALCAAGHERPGFGVRGAHARPPRGPLGRFAIAWRFKVARSVSFQVAPTVAQPASLRKPTP